MQGANPCPHNLCTATNLLINLILHVQYILTGEGATYGFCRWQQWIVSS